MALQLLGHAPCTVAAKSKPAHATLVSACMALVLRLRGAGVRWQRRGRGESNNSRHVKDMAPALFVQRDLAYRSGTAGHRCDEEKKTTLGGRPRVSRRCLQTLQTHCDVVSPSATDKTQAQFPAHMHQRTPMHMRSGAPQGSLFVAHSPPRVSLCVSHQKSMISPPTVVAEGAVIYPIKTQLLAQDGV